MNTVKSTVLGWGSLIAAAGFSFYFAKKNIDERRRQQYATGTRPTEKLDWRAKVEKEEAALKATTTTATTVPSTSSTSNNNVAVTPESSEPSPPASSNSKPPS
ncbi:hypothetical protein C8Q75DRAFT_731664 [Abortiporus biennis]|nr:hypothetical protein C8Q75DRAFT_731664 [Abortiporus biennis]